MALLRKAVTAVTASALIVCGAASANAATRSAEAVPASSAAPASSAFSWLPYAVLALTAGTGVYLAAKKNKSSGGFAISRG